MHVQPTFYLSGTGQPQGRSLHCWSNLGSCIRYPSLPDGQRQCVQSLPKALHTWPALLETNPRPLDLWSNTLTARPHSLTIVKYSMKKQRSLTLTFDLNLDHCCLQGCGWLRALWTWQRHSSRPATCSRGTATCSGWLQRTELVLEKVLKPRNPSLLSCRMVSYLKSLDYICRDSWYNNISRVLMYSLWILNI